VHKGQWVLVFGAVVLAVALYLGTKTFQTKSTTDLDSAVPDISWDELEKQAVAALSPEAKDSLDTISQLWQSADSTHREDHLRELVFFWFSHGQKPVAAYKIYQHARQLNTPQAWSDAGDAFFDVLSTRPDSVISNKMITFALQSYEKALEGTPGDLHTRIKIAEIYVQGKDPMKGIGMLREIVDSLPDYVPALTALGRLSLQSGQYDKAKERLEKVLKLEPQNTEAMYFLAIAEAESGNNEKAIQLLELCKQIVANPEFDKEINTFIQDLKNKKV
jgi:tetratricopeptide (TPR) repeat protein